MVPDKRKVVAPEKLTYDHLMNIEKTKKCIEKKYKLEYEKNRKREQRLKEQMVANIKK